MSNSNPIMRRNFLKLAGAALGGAALTCAGLTFLVTRQPEVELIQTNWEVIQKWTAKC